VFRHIVKGVRAANGEVIRLEAVRAGSRWLTSVEAIARFYERLTAAELEAAEAASDSAATSDRRDRGAATKQLDALLTKKGDTSRPK
jgi:hypothetical protein